MHHLEELTRALLLSTLSSTLSNTKKTQAINIHFKPPIINFFWPIQLVAKGVHGAAVNTVISLFICVDAPNTIVTMIIIVISLGVDGPEGEELGNK